MGSEEVVVNIKKDIAYIVLNRPKFGNALNLDTVKALLQAVIACDQNKEIRCVVLTGSGRFFCTGGDVSSFASENENIQAFLSELAGLLNLSISRLLRMQKPLLVAVNGIAAGAGMSLSLLGDVVIATEQAQFTPAYSAIGLSPDAGLTWFLPKLVGLRKAQELLFIKPKVTAQEAQDLGLITYTCSEDQFDETVQRYAEQLAGQALPAMNNMRELLLLSQHTHIETHLELEARYIAKISVEPSAKEGLSAFMEKRKANFRV